MIRSLFLAELMPNLARASWQASVLVLLILLIRRVFGPALAPRWRCALWLLVVIRLAWPFSLPSSVSLFNVFNLPLASLDSHNPLLLWTIYLFEWGTRTLESSWTSRVWLLGGALLMARVLVSWAYLLWRLRGTIPLESWDAWWLLQECKQAIGVRIPVRLVESPHLHSPCLAGFFSPRLILPKGAIATLASSELRDVFLHELAHLRRSDIPLTWILEVVRLLHWFNPLVWLACSRMGLDREEACDELALTRSAPGHPRAYGTTLVKILEGVGCGRFARSPGMAAMLGEVDPLTHRLKFILGFRHDSRTWVVGGCTWLAVAIIGFTDPVGPSFAERLAGMAVERQVTASANSRGAASSTASAGFGSGAVVNISDSVVD